MSDLALTWRQYRLERKSIDVDVAADRKTARVTAEYVETMPYYEPDIMPATPDDFRDFQVVETHDESVIGFESGECSVQSLITDAGAGWRRVAVAFLSHRPQRIPCRIVFVLHHRNRILDRAERRTCHRFLARNRRLHPGNVGKENHLFLHHVRAQFLSEIAEYLANFQKFGMISAVNGTDLLEKWTQAGNLLPGVFVMRGLDVLNQSCEWLGLPVSLVMPRAIGFVAFSK